MMQLKPIEQQVVVVVGASSGIGREAALRFARRGAKVVLASRSQEELESLAREIRSEGGEATPVAAEVTEFEQVKAVAERAVAAYGRIDTWVHVAGVGLWASLEETRPEEFRRVIDVNLVGQAYGAMAALPHLRREARGALIHVSSLEARRAMPLQSAYAASKHGVDGLIQALRMEVQQEELPISVTQVLPAAINSPLFSKARTRIGVAPRPVPPVYQPSVVADAILHAAEHPTRDIVAGGVGQIVLLGQRFLPRPMEAVVQWIGNWGQRTDVPKSAEAPDNLFRTLPGYDRIEGDFSREARGVSVSMWLSTHPTARIGLLLGSLVGGLLALAAHRSRKA
jgi:NAD(P)-dependent dehydrogenase (short-subunit alcohol dehydrogenase family)